MTEYIVFIIFGLALDICGAFLIVKPLLYFRGIWVGKNLDYFKKDFDDQTPDIRNKRIKMAWFGIIFLGVGFALQIVGNYLQYLSLNS